MDVRPGYQQTEVGVIPEDWDIAPLGDKASKVGSGITPTGGSRVYRETGRPFVRSQNVGYGRLLMDDIAFIDDQTHESFADTEIGVGDVLLNITGASIGRTAVADGRVKGGNVNQHVCIIRTKPKELHPEFLCQYLLSVHGQRQIDSFQAGGNRQGLNFSQIRSFRVPIPSNVAEQRAIAEVLTDADAFIKFLDKLIAKKQAMKQGAMQELLTGKKRLPGFSGEWEIKMLGDQCETITKGTTPTSIGRSFASSGVAFLKAEAIGESGWPMESKITYIDGPTHKILRRSQLKQGDILVSIAGVLGRIGRVERNILPANINQALAIVRLRNDSAGDRDFLYQYLQSEVVQQHIAAINVRAAQANISLLDIREFRVEVPPTKKEQSAIASVLGDIDAEIESLESKHAKARNIKLGMMQDLLTGRVRLPLKEIAA